MPWVNRCKIAIAISCLLAFAGCIPSPEDYETTPVEVTTDQGIVVCQLYTLDRVIWDRSMHRPETMSVKEADAACIDEGRRLAGT